MPRLSSDGGKSSNYQDLSAWLRHNCADKTVRIHIGVERICQAGNRIEPRDCIAVLPANGGEIATHQNLAIFLERDAKDSFICIGIESRIESAVRI